MVAAQSGVNRRLKELHIPFDPNVVTGLFDPITAAAGLYGCEVWSTRFLSEWHLEARLCRLQSYQAAELPCTSTARVCPGPLPTCWPSWRSAGTRCRSSGYADRTLKRYSAC
jgi:hypothetical protein